MTCAECGRDCSDQYSGRDPVEECDAFDNMHMIISGMWSAYLALYNAGSTIDSLVLAQVRHKIDALTTLHNQEAELARNAHLPKDYDHHA